MSWPPRVLTNDSTYVVPVGIGSPSRAYPLQLDTGSADLLIATTLCGKNCPAATKENPYYDLLSSNFEEVNGNTTQWKTRYADSSFASGFVARDQVMIAHHLVENQVIGIINATNMSLPEQDVSGVLGLGFPRLSTLGRVLLKDDTPRPAPNQLTMSAAANATSSVTSPSPEPVTSGVSGVSTSAEASSSAGLERRQDVKGAGSSSASATVPSAPAAAVPSTSVTAYLPTLMENLITTPHLPYPAFAIALSPPLNASQAAALTSLKPEPTPRYGLPSGSLTLGGVSSLYVSDNASTGRTVGDIEWWPVVPFGHANSDMGSNATSVIASTAASTENAAEETLSPSASSEATGGSTALPSASSIAAANKGTNLLEDNGAGAIGTPAKRKRALPMAPEELESEVYLYWALQLSQVSVNGTGFSLKSSYANVGVPSIALLDVGTNGLYGPEADISTLFSKIKDARMVSAGQWAVPCDTKINLGFSFGQGGRTIEIPPKDWIYAAVPESSMCLAWPVAVQSTGDGMDWQLGTPFLRNTYTVFSYGIDGTQAPQIGFLPLIDKSNGTQPVSAANPSQTVQTKLPHVLLPAPNFPTPSYAFSTPLPTLGQPQDLGLGNKSAYQVQSVPVISIPVPSPSASDHQAIPGWPGDSAQATVDDNAARRIVPLTLTLLIVPFVHLLLL